MRTYPGFLSALLFALTTFCAVAQAAQAAQAIDRPVDKLLLIKSERSLQLLHKGEVLKTYRISLGKQPKGAKQREGDQRTPEGIYFIDWRQKSANFNLSLHISYPNQRDRERAEKAGVNPGGMIMIHGTPSSAEFPDWFFRGLDWTEGCIALNNADMREVWDYVADYTLIEIRP
ncbi:hypothetical protein AXE65_03960 [Ventosimonas gracilis]|uniref:L,D-TPase catalytic domain-containing protein n=1 Tax=Ventosimonas gracilis TaxID=1680762 RepID=A0A139SRN7_9GAMM|nr:hypothetical protein AXE65_03960 [Ventosimonas gracilis]